MTPAANHGEVGDAVLDEHPFVFRHGEEKFMELRLVILPQRATTTLAAVFEFEVFREFLERDLNGHKNLSLSCRESAPRRKFRKRESDLRRGIDMEQRSTYFAAHIQSPSRTELFFPPSSVSFQPME
jgi:hypothetical protein